MEPYRFSGDLDYDASSGELRRAGVVTRLEPQPAAVLALLASRAGAVVTHDEIAQAVWREGTHVNYREGVHYCVRQVRLALADSALAPRYIETIPRRGYRFRSDALRPAEDAEPAAIPGPVASAHVLRPAWRRFRLVVACAAALIVAATLVIERRPNNHHEIALSLLRTLHDVLY